MKQWKPLMNLKWDSLSHLSFEDEFDSYIHSKMLFSFVDKRVKPIEIVK